MKILSHLTLSLCVVSVVSTILYCILPEHNGYKNAFKTVSGVICSVIIFTSLLNIFKFKNKKVNLIETNVNVSIVEEYIIQKNTEAYLIDVADKTSKLFKNYNVKCSKICIDNESSSLAFYVDKKLEGIEKELNKLTNVNCIVMVGEYDE